MRYENTGCAVDYPIYSLQSNPSVITNTISEPRPIDKVRKLILETHIQSSSRIYENLMLKNVIRQNLYRGYVSAHKIALLLELPEEKIIYRLEERLGLKKSQLSTFKGGLIYRDPNQVGVLKDWWNTFKFLNYMKYR